MSGLGHELRYVLRVLRRSPGFTLIAVLSLAIGIGANTAMLGVVRTLLLNPLSVERPQELKLLAWSREGDYRVNAVGETSYPDSDTGAPLRSNFSYPIYQALRDAAPSDVDLCAFAFLRSVSVALENQPAFAAGGALVDGHYFSTLKIPMALGRPIVPDDDAPRAPLVAVLSHTFWMRAFGGDRSVVGRTVRVNGVTAEVIGVSADGFKGLSMGGFFPQTEITLPVAAQPSVYRQLSAHGSRFRSDDLFWLRVMARVSSRTSEAIVQQRLAAAMRTVPSPLVGGDGHLPELRLVDGSEGAQPVRPQTARLLYLLLGVVGIVLLIACVNLASLMLARGVGRQREMAVRSALGSSRAQLMRLALLEAVVLSVAGTAAGLALASLSRNALRGLLTGSLGSGAFGDLDIQVSLDPLVLAFGVTLAAAATIASGLLPALRLSGIDPIGWLRQQGSGGSTPRLRAGGILVAVQIAVSVPLVVGAILFVRTLANLGSVQLGFDPRGIVSFQVDPAYTRLSEERYPWLYQQLLARVLQVPGVRSVTLVENAPMSGIVSNSFLDVSGRRVVLYKNAIGPAFLETMGASLLAGRMPGLQDDREAPAVGVVNQAAVRELYGGASPVGRTLRTDGLDVQIVGVVNDMPYRNARDPVPPTLYQSAFQRKAWGGYHVFVRTGTPLSRLEGPLRAAVAEIDPDIPVPRIRTQSEIIAQASAKERAFTQLLTIFAGFALLLASIGLHGVTSYAVTRRTGEIGVRVALGAAPGQILWTVLREAVVLAVAGLLVGVPAAIAGAPLVRSLLYGVAPTSPATITAAATVMLAIAVAAGLLPALRAARLDPLVALRHE
ncbi:MAG: ABC transporter permease [Acidobacteria bacterium]|nr:ABC transporter permease [Acidobacteriota bacterium]